MTLGKLRSLLRLLGALLVSAPVWGAARPASAEQRALDAMNVQVANRDIIALRGPIAGYSARERATGAMSRIEAVLDEVPNPQVSMKQTPDGTQVLLEGKSAFLVTRADIDATIGETTEIGAREAARRLTGVLE